jgi:hypothetical protein
MVQCSIQGLEQRLRWRLGKWRRQSQGTLIPTIGQVYVGAWRDDKKHGKEFRLVLTEGPNRDMERKQDARQVYLSE